MAHAGPSDSTQPSRKQTSRLQRALRRYFALLAALVVIVLVGAGCSLTQPAKAHERNRPRHHRPTATTAAAGQSDDQGDDQGDDDPTDTTADPTATTAAPTDTTADPTATTAAPTDTTADPTATTAAPTATTAAGQGQQGALPFSTTACDPAGLPQATGQQTDEIGGPVCNTGIFGVITGPQDLPTVKITKPANGDQFSLADMIASPANQVPCEIAFNNFQGGTFDGTGKNGQAREFGLRPFSVNANGDAIGHAHCYLRDDANGPTDQLQSFLALNQANQGNTLAGVMPPLADDPASLGTKKMCVDLAGGNHMTWNKGVAQRFPAVDCITIEITQ